MKNLITLSTCVDLFCFGLWPIALILVYVVSHKDLMKEKRRLIKKPLIYSNFEQKRLFATWLAYE